MTLTREDLAYIAGFFDGEGCVQISKCINRARQAGYRYQLECKITQKCPCPLFDSLRKEFGGWIHETKQEEILNYRLYAQQARTFLREIVPYLRLKKEQAEAGIAFQNSLCLQGRRLSSAECQAREKAYRRLQALKPTNIARDTSRFQNEVTMDTQEYIQLVLHSEMETPGE